MNSIGALNAVISEFPTSCERDSDCAGYFYRGDFNPNAVILAKPGATKEQEPRLFAAQDAVRLACKNERWAKSAEAKPFKARCENRRCEDAKTSQHYYPPGEFLGHRPFWLAMSFLYAFLLYFRLRRPLNADASASAFYLARWAGFFAGALVIGWYVAGDMLTSPFGAIVLPGVFIVAGALAVGFGAAAYLLLYPVAVAWLSFSRQ